MIGESKFAGYEWTASGQFPIEKLEENIRQYRAQGKRIITTNGCFDLLHSGHISSIANAKALGDVLIIGLNSDQSVRRIKGYGRPIIPESERAALLFALRDVDHVVVFDDLLPNEFLALVRPDIHCKSGDYQEDSLPESSIVKQFGGEICILPTVKSHSTTQIINKIVNYNHFDNLDSLDTFIAETQPLTDYLFESGNLLQMVAYRQSAAILEIAKLMIATFKSRHKIIFCGNGGSAADAQHFVSELVGRFGEKNEPLAAISLTADMPDFSGLGNDYGFEQVFARKLETIGYIGDILIAISTSGQSVNVIRAVEVAKRIGVIIVAFTGFQHSLLRDLADYELSIPSKDTSLIQQGYIAAFHGICRIIEQEFTTGDHIDRKPISR